MLRGAESNDDGHDNVQRSGKNWQRRSRCRIEYKPLLDAMHHLKLLVKKQRAKNRFVRNQTGGETEESHTCSLTEKAMALTDEKWTLAEDSWKTRKIVEAYLLSHGKVFFESRAKL